MTNEYSEAVSETLEVLQYIDDKLLNKIPLDVIKKLKGQRSTSYIDKFKETGEVDPSKLSNKAKDVLAVIYMEYVANEEEKIEFNKILDKNELKGNGQDYIIKSLKKQEESIEELLPILAKKGFFQKLFEKIFKTNKGN